MSRALGGFVLIGALAGAGCADPPAAETPAKGQDAHILVCAPGSFQDGNECLPIKQDCPPGTVAGEGGCVAMQVASEPEPPPNDPPAAAVAAGAPPGLDAVVDGRRGRLQPRSRQLLITELQGLESLYQSVPKDAPDRPRLMRRLAEGYVELSAAAARDGKLATGADEATKARKIEMAAGTAAIKYYQRLVQEYPKFCTSGSTSSASASSGCPDEVLYYLGLEYIRAGKQDMARKVFLDLIKNYPQSDFVAPTYFQFGEMFLAEARQDPSKWELAEQAYQQVGKVAGSSIQPWGLLRLAEVYDGKGDPQKAAQTRAKLVKDHPSSAPTRQIAPSN